MTVYDRLKVLDVELPPMTAPVAAFVPFVQSGNFIFVSGHIAKQGGKPWAGQLGVNIDTARGREAARLVAVDILGTLHAAAGGLHRIKRLVKLMVLVNSAPTFTEQHLVANGASEFFEQALGEVGRHARSAFGVAQIPFGACVEIDAIAEVEGEQS